jgi:hypothetical protein
LNIIRPGTSRLSLRAVRNFNHMRTPALLLGASLIIATLAGASFDGVDELMDPDRPADV